MGKKLNSTKEEKGRKIKGEKRVNVILVLVLILVFLIFVFLAVYFIKFSSDPNRYDYQGKNGVFHITKEVIYGIDIYSIHIFSNNIEYIYHFRNHPENLEDIYLEDDLINKLNRPEGIRTLYVTRPPDLGERTNNFDVVALAPLEHIVGTGRVGLYKIHLVNAYTIYFRDGVTKANCNDVSNYTAVVQIQLSENTRIMSTYDECIIIEGKDTEDLIRAGEKFAYYLLGVF